MHPERVQYTQLSWNGLGWKGPESSPTASPLPLKQKAHEACPQQDSARLLHPDQHPPSAGAQLKLRPQQLPPYRRTEKTRAIFPMALILFLMISLRTVVPPEGEKRDKHQHVSGFPAFQAQLTSLRSTCLPPGKELMVYRFTATLWREEC